MLRRSRSATVRAAMDSMTTTALGTMIGSCRPFTESSTSSMKVLTVCCTEEIDGVGLMAARKQTVLPSLIPPSVPPEWLVCFANCPFWMQNASLFSVPFAFAAANPSPISKPLTAPTESTAWASRASSLSKTGSPIPAGSPVI